MLRGKLSGCPCKRLVPWGWVLSQFKNQSSGLSASMSSGKKPVDYAKTDEIKELLRKAEEARGCLGLCAMFLSGLESCLLLRRAARVDDYIYAKRLLVIHETSVHFSMFLLVETYRSRRLKHGKWRNAQP